MVAEVKVFRFVRRRSEKREDSEEDQKSTGDGGYHLNQRSEAVVVMVASPWKGHRTVAGRRRFPHSSVFPSREEEREK